MAKISIMSLTAPLALAMAAAASLSGCAIAQPIMTPSGAQGFTVDCSAMNNMGACYKKAGELCGGNGYTVFAKHDKSAGFFSPADQNMVIQCKSPALGML